MRECFRTNLFLRCWMLPRHLKVPFTIMAKRPQRASHSSILWHKRHLHSYLNQNYWQKPFQLNSFHGKDEIILLRVHVIYRCIITRNALITVTDCTCHYLWQLKMWLYISRDHIHGIGKCMQDYINFGQRDTCMGLKLSSSHILYVTQIKCTYLSYQFLCDAK